MLDGKNDLLLDGKNDLLLDGKNDLLLDGKNDLLLDGKNDLLLDGKKYKNKIKKSLSDLQEVSVIKKILIPNLQTTPAILQYHREKSSIKLKSLIELNKKVIAASCNICQFCCNPLIEINQDQFVLMEISYDKLSLKQVCFISFFKN